MKRKLRSLQTKRASILEQITTIHGISRLKSKDERIIWTIIMICNAVLTITFIMVIKQRYNSDQIVTTISANCRVNQVPFPTVSICNFNMVAVKETKNIKNILKYHNISHQEIFTFFEDMRLLKNFGLGTKKVKNHKKIMHILKHHYFTVDTIMEEIHQKCEDMILYCTFNRKEKKCSDVFKLIKTLEGHCCSFNYAALNDGIENLLTPKDDDLEYYVDDTSEGKVTTDIIITSESGRSSGLSVVFNVEPDDYLKRSTIGAYGAKVLISDPNDFPETTVLNKFVTLGQSVDIKVEPLVFQSDPNIRGLEPEKRSCWFSDEVTLEHTDRYSFETCNTECKMATYEKLCGCVPYKYPRDKLARVCELEDLKCLNNVTVFVSKEQYYCNVVCYMECRDKKYTMTSDTVPFLSQEFPEYVTKHRNVSQLSALNVYFVRPSSNCYTLKRLMDINYFIVTYGGVFSLSFGASIITVFELLYLLLSTLLTFVWRKLSLVIQRVI